MTHCTDAGTASERKDRGRSEDRRKQLALECGAVAVVVVVDGGVDVVVGGERRRPTFSPFPLLDRKKSANSKDAFMAFSPPRVKITKREDRLRYVRPKKKIHEILSTTPTSFACNNGRGVVMVLCSTVPCIVLFGNKSFYLLQKPASL